jgi:hypothetical protein
MLQAAGVLPPRLLPPQLSAAATAALHSPWAGVAGALLVATGAVYNAASSGFNTHQGALAAMSLVNLLHQGALAVQRADAGRAAAAAV